MNKGNYYLGLDIGTDSVGYAVTDKEYNLKKFHGQPAWGVTIFDEASLNTERRGFRTSRRRLERRKQRVHLLQELFSKEVEKMDPDFFVRLQRSSLFREDIGYEFTLFNDKNYTDKEFHKQYPTVHHLIVDLMNNTAPHDVRLVYLALAWLVSHRGHFLSNINKENLGQLTDFNTIYSAFLHFFDDNGLERPWKDVSSDQVSDVLREKLSITSKSKNLTKILFENGKAPKEPREEFPYNTDSIIKLLAGGSCKLKDVFCNDEYEEYGSVSLGMDDEKLGEIMANIGDDFDLINNLRSLYDWGILTDVLGTSQTISDAKVKMYEQHEKDLALLKRIVKKYLPTSYNEIFRRYNEKTNNYTSYVYHTNSGDTSNLKKTTREEFSKYILNILKNIIPDKNDSLEVQDMTTRLELRTFMPKQKNTDNRVIPHQLYWFELNRVLETASSYLPFLSEKQEDGLTVSEKIHSIFLFKIPYYVGPLNKHSKFAWIERKAGKIYPWNFEDMVNQDLSEQNFIQKMTNTCTYLPGEPVLPKDSLCYHKFSVLNEINNLRINGERISVELKQDIYNDLFLRIKKVTRKKLIDYLIANGVVSKDQKDAVSGIDEEIKSNLAPQIAFSKLLEKGILKEADAERIIERSSFAEDKTRLSKWLVDNYPNISEEDRRYICNLKIKDFGRLSRRFLCGFEGTDKSTGEITTILGALWNSQNNLMEILSDKYTFSENLKQVTKDYYLEHAGSLEQRLDEMYISNAVRRPIYRTLSIVHDIKKAFGEPEKIFIEMARGGAENQKGKRTKSRKQQILELYDLCKDEDVKHLRKQLEDMGEYCDNKLQGDRIFLYYMQLGKSMYSGVPIDLDKIGTKEYDIDHIYPQAMVKDDSIINNKVLVLSKENGEKSDIYPIKDSIRHQMYGYWKFLKDTGLISEEKFRRLTRATPFTEDEKWGFINRQLTETTQSTKAIAELLKEQLPETEIVYVKAKLTSEFRQEFDLYKSRSFNDLHHAVDAYLNIVTGNVYHMRFSKRWFAIDKSYSVKTKTLFTHPVLCGGETVWDGTQMLQNVKKTAQKNNAQFTKFAYLKTGGFFDQMPVSADANLIPLKKGLDTEKYGGYNRPGVMFFIPVKYSAGKKEEIIIMSVELLMGKEFLSNEAKAREYSFSRLERILGKKVDSVDFPMGLRPWKVNTMLSLDGFRVCIAGSAGGGKCLIAQPVMQFAANPFWTFYIKKIERFVEKCKENPEYIYDEVYDRITEKKNLELYDLYLEKLEHSIYKKRINAPVATLKEGRNTFKGLSIKQQAEALLNIQAVFGRVSGGCDLTAIGGKGKAAATVNFSSTISNWKKNYSDVRIIDASPSGLWEKVSVNLLGLL